MHTKSKSAKVSRPVAPTENKPVKAKAKLWVLWEPATQTFVIAIMIAVLASMGVVAMQYSDVAAGNGQAQASTSQLLWQDAPASPVGSSIASGKGSASPMRNWRTANNYIYGGGAIRVVADDTKGEALEFFGAANKSQSDANGQNQRAEQIANFSVKKDSTYWFGFDLWVAPGSGVASGKQSIWQILPQPDRSQAKLWLALNSNREGLALETDTASLPIGQASDKSWDRIVIGVHVADDEKAWLELWRNGQQVVGRQFMPGGVLAKNADSGLMAAGIYRSEQAWDLKVRMANLKVATTRDVVF